MKRTKMQTTKIIINLKLRLTFGLKGEKNLRWYEIT